METVRVVCAHDCPDMCSLLADVEDGRVLRVRGDPEQPFTAGFACSKVNRDADLVHSPERIETPLRRTGPKGESRFEPISWDKALDEITARWQRIIAESGGILSGLPALPCAVTALAKSPANTFTSTLTACVDGSVDSSVNVVWSG